TSLHPRHEPRAVRHFGRHERSSPVCARKRTWWDALECDGSVWLLSSQSVLARNERGIMYRQRLLASLLGLSFIITACTDGGAGPVTESFSRTVVVSDAYYPAQKSRIRFDQTIQGAEGTVTATFINDT